MTFRYLGFILCLPGAVLCMQKLSTPPAHGVLEFPVVMRQKVVAGATRVGTPVKATLVIATLVNGVVIPQDAVFTGEVTESVAKSDAAPSRLAIRMDAANWKNGSTSIKLYLTPWYYPLKPLIERRNRTSPAPFGAEGGATLGSGTARPSSVDSGRPRFPGENDPAFDPDTMPIGPLVPELSEHRALLQDTHSDRGADGAIVLTCARRNLKLDKSTTYVLAADDLPGSTAGSDQHAH